MNDQDTLFGVEVTGVDRDHALARFTDPTTSDAADAQLRRREGGANTIRRGTHRHQALAACSVRPLTADEIQVATGIEGVWKRVSDLKNMGFLERAGGTRLSRAGRDQEVLRITDEGWAALALLNSEGAAPK